MIQALVFDLDDTLFAERDFVLGGFRAVDQWLESSGRMQGFFGRAQAAYEAGVRGHIFNAALSASALAEDSVLIRTLVDVYRAHPPRIRLFDDAAWALNHFGKDLILGLITDGYLHTQRNKIRALKIESCFDATICSDEFGREFWKPSPLPYRKLMEVVGCSPEVCAYVADNPLKDFITPNQLGWLSIQIVRPGSDYARREVAATQQAHFQIGSLRELEAIVARS